MSLLMACASCSKSSENQAQENIQEFITKKMDDPKSYESVNFGKLDSLFSPFEDSKEGITLKLEDENLSKRLDELSNQIDVAKSIPELQKIQEEDNIITARRSKLVDIILEKSLKYKGEFVGFKIKHSFRGKNKMGALILDSCTVVLDKNLKVKLVK